MASYFLSKVDFTVEQDHVRRFESRETLHKYVETKKSATKTHNNFIVQDSEITVDFPFAEAQGYNYIAYNNGSVWEYAFITAVNVISTKNTQIQTRYDVWQNNAFDLTFGNCFVDREHRQRHRKVAGGMLMPLPHHVSDIPVGNLYATHKSILPQIRRSVSKDPLLFLIIAYQVGGGTTPGVGNFTAESSYSPVEATSYATIPFNPKDVSQVIVPGISTLADILDTDLFKSPNTRAIYYTPYIPVNVNDPSAYTSYSFYEKDDITLTAARPVYTGSLIPTYKYFVDVELPQMMGAVPESSINSNDASNIYSETKLLSSPYFKTIFRFETASVELGWEDLAIYVNDGKSYVRLNIEVSCTLDGANIVFVPDTYDPANRDLFSQSVKISKFTPLESDAFLEYIFANRATFNTGLRNNIIEIAASTALTLGTAAVGGGDAAAFAGGAVISGVSRVAQEMNMRNDLKSAPKQMRSTANDFLDAFSDVNPPYICFYVLTPRIEEQRSIFDYYNRYGYKVNRNKIPFTTSRKWYNYVKLTDPVIIGVYDNDDLTFLKNMFIRGTTLWHTYYNSSTNSFIGKYIGDYSGENGESIRTITNPDIDTSTDDFRDPTPEPVGPPTPIPVERFTNKIFPSTNISLFADFQGTSPNNFKNKSDIFLYYTNNKFVSGQPTYDFNLIKSGKLVDIIENGGVVYDGTKYEKTRHIGFTYIFEHYEGFKTHVCIKGSNISNTNTSEYVKTLYNNTSLITNANIGDYFTSLKILGSKSSGSDGYSNINCFIGFEWYGKFIDPRLLDTSNNIGTLNPTSFTSDIYFNSPSTDLPFSFITDTSSIVGNSKTPFSQDNRLFNVPVGGELKIKDSFWDTIPVSQRSTAYIRAQYGDGSTYNTFITLYGCGTVSNVSTNLYFDSINPLSNKKMINITNTSIIKYANRTPGVDIVLGTFLEDKVDVLIGDNYPETPINYLRNRWVPINKSSVVEDPTEIVNKTGFMQPFKDKSYPIFREFGADPNFPLGMQWHLPGQAEIFSIQSGTVIDVYKWYDLTPSLQPKYGAYIIIDHGTIGGKNYKSIYSHLSKIKVNIGDKITKGFPLATIDNYSNEHLGVDIPEEFYLELRENNVAINPKNLIVKW